MTAKLGILPAILLLALPAAALAKGGLPAAWKVGVETDLPKGTAVGGDACAKVTATVHDLNAPYTDPTIPHDKPQSGRDRMSGQGKYGDPKELTNWVEFRFYETCPGKNLWGQMWAKVKLSKDYSFAGSLKCPGWVEKDSALTSPAGASPGKFVKLDAYNYASGAKSVEVRSWDAKDYNGQGKGVGVCPK